MEAVFRRPAGRQSLISPAFCHGLAGLLAICLRFANETGNAVIVDGVNDLGRDLVNRYEAAAPFGYRSEDRPGERVDRPGLLEGAPGVIVALLAASTDVEPRWDRLFLLS